MDCGKTPWIPWKSPMDILEKFHGHTGKSPWTFSMDSLEIVQCFCSNTPAGQCPLIPWTLSTDSMDFFHWFHGLSTDGWISNIDYWKTGNQQINVDLVN